MANISQDKVITAHLKQKNKNNNTIIVIVPVEINDICLEMCLNPMPNLLCNHFMRWRKPEVKEHQ